MVWRKTIALVTVITLGIGVQIETNVAQAGIFDMMSPSKWFGNSNRDYYDGGYGYGPGYNRWGGGPYGWGGGPYGWGGGPYGWGGGPYGWGGGPYGWGHPGYYGHPYQTAPATEKSAPRLPE
jgi:hypothetical protein